jgi:hypothetical protein
MIALWLSLALTLRTVTLERTRSVSNPLKWYFVYARFRVQLLALRMM